MDHLKDRWTRMKRADWDRSYWSAFLWVAGWAMHGDYVNSGAWVMGAIISVAIWIRVNFGRG